MRRMEFGKYRDIEYCVFDPTGNITALVESAVDAADQPAVASRIMELEPDVEQVGFVRFADKDESVAAPGGAPVSLRMAGGEFCGNATMCAAALFATRRGLQGGAVPVKVSGASAPLTVTLERQAALSFSAAVSMPPALSIGKIGFSAAGADAGQEAGGTPPAAGSAPATDQTASAITESAPAADQPAGATAESAPALSLPVVKMEGISHIIIEPDSGFFGLKDDPALAEALLKNWCGVLGADCLGMMFLGDTSAVNGEWSRPLLPLTPLVYVPGADTMFWENSCASGSTAAGMYLAAKTGKAVDVTFDEPAGRLRVESDPETDTTILHGSVLMR